MNTNEDFFTKSKQSVKEYMEDRLLLAKLQLVDHISKFVGSVATIIISVMLSLIFLILIAITGGLLFAKLTGDLTSGFAIMSGVVLLLILIVVVALKKRIQSRVVHSLLQKIFKKKTSN